MSIIDPKRIGRVDFLFDKDLAPGASLGWIGWEEA
jgi:hypothetical protein